MLRAIALQSGTVVPPKAGGRRDLWARAGVLTDEVSTTVLTLGLRPKGHGAVAMGVRARSEGGYEAHLTLRDLRRLEGLAERGTVVWVCENPRVLEAAMDAGSRAIVVCTAGNPTLVATTLLEQLVAEGAALRYHGDFDWPGIAIANRVIETFDAVPWRMGAVDYREALASAVQERVELVPLEGRPVVAVWDGDLNPAMVRGGVAVHEESMLDLLVECLLTSAATTQPAL